MILLRLMAAGVYLQFCLRELKMSDFIDKELPPVIPIFPLAGALLLPGGQLPLNIFEPRYISMTDYVLGNGRYLGMVQSKTVEQQIGTEECNLYTVGCLGKMSAFAELETNRYVITLSGLSRFKIISEEQTLNAWRSVKVDYKSFNVDQKNRKVDNFSREAFLDALQAYFSLHNIKGSWESIEKVDEATLITSVAMAAPLSSEEKQAILECVTLVEQAKMLQSLMEMAVYGKDNGGAKLHH